MIRCSDDHISRYYSDICSKSWIDDGHEVEYVEGCTPETIGKPPYNDMEFGLIARRREYKEFSESEKSVFYSHRKAFRTLAESGEPYGIIAEHDALLVQPIIGRIVANLNFAYLGHHLGETALSNEGEPKLLPCLSMYCKREWAEQIGYSPLWERKHNCNSDGIIRAIIDGIAKHEGNRSKMAIRRWNDRVQHFVTEEMGTTIDHSPNSKSYPHFRLGDKL